MHSDIRMHALFSQSSTMPRICHNSASDTIANANGFVSSARGETGATSGHERIDDERSNRKLGSCRLPAWY
jgi:hypothetical protein